VRHQLWRQQCNAYISAAALEEQMKPSLFTITSRLALVITAFVLSGLLAFYAMGNNFGMPTSLAELIRFFQTSPTIIDEPEPPEIAPPIQLKDSFAMHSRSNSQSAGDNHGEEYKCEEKEFTTGISKIDTAAIYRWTDEQGNTQFSDTAPTEDPYEKLSSIKKLDFFDLKVLYPAGTMNESHRDKIEIGGRAIYKIYANYLPFSLMTKAQVNVLIFSDKNSYDRYKRKHAPTMANDVPGFYSSATNQAIVAGHRTSEQTYETALHEVAHAIHAGNFGSTPKWYNEGMAEVLEEAQSSGSLITIPPDNGWVAQLGKTLPIMNLTQLLNSTSTDWDSESRSAYYANAWSLAFYLMQPTNAEFMRSLQVALTQDRCMPLDTYKFVESNFRGGVVSLQQGWHQWQQGGQFSPLRF
jgi:hypothetical protein